MNWSFQLYSARNFQPWDDVLRMVAEVGYSQVEGFGGVYDDPKGFKAMLDENGLTMPSGHFSLDMLEKETAKALDIADALGVGIVICPHLAVENRPTDADGWKRFGERLAVVGDAVKLAGKRFAWHNHDFEFASTADGAVPQRLILQAAPDIGWEMDVAWVARGGADPLAWIEEFGPRIVAAHVKDIAPAGEAEDEDGWADVGHGTMDWKGLMAALRASTPADIFVMEHDNPSDAARFARRSIEAANRF
ncbi:sugar phosphate isomerase/epimerase family protein [Mesorhizobium xinjiangense]|uniref:sugar phosphate isomerase/epimerase family protein n=1 Tax=Mesorhizobium xinjiangense TaxID=2678685 RepID=UPI0012ED94B2|nr:sugar phosphate isomerase/epimerase [Mesorhizobium xinjiangense]